MNHYDNIVPEWSRDRDVQLWWMYVACVWRWRFDHRKKNILQREKKDGDKDKEILDSSLYHWSIYLHALYTSLERARKKLRGRRNICCSNWRHDITHRYRHSPTISTIHDVITPAFSPTTYLKLYNVADLFLGFSTLNKTRKKKEEETKKFDKFSFSLLLIVLLYVHIVY